MPTVFIPSPLRKLADGKDHFLLEGKTVGELMSQLEQQNPALANALCPGGELKQGLAVAVDGSMSNRGLYQKVQENSEVHFLPMVGGG